jgi:hypothetical protein
MADPRVIPVKSLADFAKQVEKYLTETRRATPSHKNAMNWYRGHSRSVEQRLEPGLYRHKKVKKIEDLLALEISMMAEFERQSLLHSFQTPTDPARGLILQLFYMQHHGVPTRLLDWTSNPFIALYFALSGAKATDKGTYDEAAAVWVLDPYRWNKHSLAELKWGDQGPARIEDTDVQSYLPTKPLKGQQPTRMYDDAIALIGSANTQRMLAQKGHFTLFGESTEPMERAYDLRGFPNNSLVKLEVPADKISEILSVLLAVGYTDSVAYPDLQGLAMEIRRTHGFLS